MSEKLLSVKVEDIKFLKDYYPRADFNNETVNAYRLNIDALPPITVNKDLVLIDGYHRLLAHKLEGKKEIEAEVLDVPEEEILWYATKLNAKHGFQLRKEDKQRLARMFYENHHKTLSEISEVLAVSESTLSNWLRSVIAEKRREREKQIIDLYLQCYTQEEIANKVKLSQGRIAQIINKFKIEISNNPVVMELYKPRYTIRFRF